MLLDTSGRQTSLFTHFCTTQAIHFRCVTVNDCVTDSLRQLTPKLTGHQACVTARCVTATITKPYYLHDFSSETSQNMNIYMLLFTSDLQYVRLPYYLHGLLALLQPLQNIIIYMLSYLPPNPIICGVYTPISTTCRPEL